VATTKKILNLLTPRAGKWYVQGNQTHGYWVWKPLNKIH